MDLFHIEPFLGQPDGTMSFLPHHYTSINFEDEKGNPIRMRPFLKDYFYDKLNHTRKEAQKSRESVFAKSLDSVLEEIKSTNCFKNALVKISPLSPFNQALTIKLKTKSAYYFSVQQSFNTEGNIIMKYSGGFRNVAGMFDNLSFEYEKSLQKDKLSTGNVNWAFPFWYGNSTLDINFQRGETGLDTRIVEQKQGLSFKFALPSKRFTAKYTVEDRINHFDPDDVSKYILLQEMMPSLAHRLEFKWNIIDNQYGATDLKVTQGLGESKYTGFEVDSKVNVKLEKYLSEDLPNKYKKLRFENYLNAKIIGFEKGRLRVNDRIHFIQLRGFQKVGQRDASFNSSRHPRRPFGSFSHQGDHLGSRLAIRNTSKLIFDSFPILESTEALKPFFHLTSIFLSPDSIPRSFTKHLSLSAGIGMDLAYGPGHIEFLYNFWHMKQRDDTRNFFQVKFAFGD